MAIENADRVDSISRTPDGNSYTLLMVEDRPFEDSDERFHQLLEKINAYMLYVQGGQFYEDYPEARGKRLQVRLVCYDEPVGERFIALLGAATQMFGRHDVDFVVEVIPLELLGRPAPDA